MACKITDKRLVSIKKLVAALVGEGQAKTLDEVHTWFKDNRPNVTQNEINEALTATSEKRMSDIRTQLEKDKVDITSRSNIINKIRESISLLKVGDVKGLDARLKELDNSIVKLRKLIDTSKDLEKQDIAQLYTDTQDIMMQYKEVLMGKKELKDVHLDLIKERLKALEDRLEYNKTDNKVKTINEQIDKIKKGELDVNEAIDLNQRVFLKESSLETVRKESELSHLKAVYDRYVEERVEDAKVAKTGLLGYKGKTALKVARGLRKAAKEGWEVERTLKFMFDSSAVGVQLAPVVMSDLWSNQSRLGEMFRTTIIDVFNSDKVAAIEGWKSDPNKTAKENNEAKLEVLKRSAGRKAEDLMNEIKAHPFYPFLKKMGLKISEAKSVTKSDEMWHSTVLNKLPFFGLAKDMSENLMVSSLNFYRFALAKEYLIANPTAGPEEVKKVVGYINAATGTDKAGAIAGDYGNLVFSAIRLMISRFKMAFKYPLGVIGSVDVNKSLKEKGLKFQSSADQYIARQLGNTWKAYAATFSIFAIAAMLRNMGCDECPHIDFGRDWQDTDFLKVTLGNSKYEFTGGIGAMYRMVAEIIMTQHIPDNATFSVRERLNIQRKNHDNDLWDPAFRTLAENKLHPTPTAVKGVVTGKDFFNKPFAPGAISARVEALGRAISPISVETLLDLGANKETVKSEGLIIGTIDKAIGTVGQLFGLNVFPLKDRSSSAFAKRYFDSIGKKPGSNYPDELSLKNMEESLAVQYMRNKYKDAHGNMMADIIDDNENISKSEFLSKVNAGESKLSREFLKENKEIIDEIKALRKQAQKKK